MNILQVSCEGLGNGGVQKIIMDITRKLSSTENIDVVLFTNEKRYYDDEFSNYGNIYRISNSKKNRILKSLDYYTRGPKIFFKVMKIFKNKKYDVIHCHNDYESGICLFAAYLSGVKIRISHLHKSDYDRKGNIINAIYNSFLRRLLLKYSTNIVCCSNLCKKTFFMKETSKYIEKADVLLNCIDVSKFKMKQIPTKLKNVCKLAHVGRFCENKNQLFILEVLKALIDMGKRANLTLVGFGDEYRIKIENRAKKLNIERYLEILPSDTNIPELLEKTDVFIFPSLNEGLGIVLLEAQAARVPCVASDAVPTEANLGLVEYVSLQAGAVQWANKVIAAYECEAQIEEEKLMSIDINTYIKRIKEIYGCY